MKRITIESLEPRLQKRYRTLVQSELRSAPRLAAGVASLPKLSSSFAATQAAWRFLNNERIGLPALAEPLRKAGLSGARESSADFVMVAHDWCKLSFEHPRGKRDRIQLTHATDVGYELTTALLVDAQNGRPLCPMELQLKTADGVMSTRSGKLPVIAHLEQVLPSMEASRAWGLQKPILHVIDREADSVDHYRQWDAQGHAFLVRADERRVQWEGETVLLSRIAQVLGLRKKLQAAGKAGYRGQAAQLWFGETQVTLHRPAKKNVRDKRFERPGRSLSLRFVVVELRDPAARVLSRWMLLSNAPEEWASADILARCYYWRWRIESFFKLLKSHGQQLEHWQQQAGKAIARRLLIAPMACVLVWQLQADRSTPALKLKNVLVRLSGRQTKRHRPHTAPALLAGLGVLLPMLSLYDHLDLSQLKLLINNLSYIPLEALV